MQGDCKAKTDSNHWRGEPRGPFPSKNTTALESVAVCYCRSLLLSVLFLAPLPWKTSISKHSPYCLATTAADLLPVPTSLSVLNSVPL